MKTTIEIWNDVKSSDLAGIVADLQVNEFWRVFHFAWLPLEAIQSNNVHKHWPLNKNTSKRFLLHDIVNWK